MIKDIKSNKIFLTIVFCLILLLAIVLRFACLNKVDGLWYDELTMYNEAIQPTFFKVLIYSLVDDVHFPLYQICLHYWGQIFSFSDISLRSFSAVIGILTVIVGYFIGKSLNSKFVSFILMLLFAINSYLIYYSQEVKMYELIAFFASLNLLFLIRIDKYNTFKDRLFWILTTCGLVFSYLISFIFVISEVICFKFYRGKELPKHFFKMVSFMLGIMLLLLLLIAFFKKGMRNFVSGMYSDWSSLFVAIQNFFTPKLVGIGNNPIHYMGQFIQNFSVTDFIFVVVPIFIACYFICEALKKDKFARFIFAVSIIFVLIEVMAFILVDFKILSRYLLIILPNMLTLIAIGAKDYKNKISVILISAFVLINFSYLLYSPRASYKLGRDGYIPIIKMLEESEINDKDIVFVWNRKEVLSKYLDKNVTVLSVLKDIAYKSEYALINQKKLNNSDVETKKKILKEYFSLNLPAENTEILMAFVISHMTKGQKIMLVTNGYFDDFTSEGFYKSIKNEDTFNSFTFNNLMTIKATLDLKYICNHSLKYVGSYKKGFYVLQVWEK